MVFSGEWNVKLFEKYFKLSLVCFTLCEIHSICVGASLVIICLYALYEGVLGSGGVAPLILNLGSIWKLAVILTPWRRGHRYPSNRKLARPPGAGLGALGLYKEGTSSARNRTTIPRSSHKPRSRLCSSFGLSCCSYCVMPVSLKSFANGEKGKLYISYD
jgi:hypothetical protein